MSIKRVSTRSASYLYAIAQRGDLAVNPSRSRARTRLLSRLRHRFDTQNRLEFCPVRGSRSKFPRTNRPATSARSWASRIFQEAETVRSVSQDRHLRLHPCRKTGCQAVAWQRLLDRVA